MIEMSQVSREETKQALATAAALDDKSPSAFHAESSDLADCIDVLTRTVAALEKGVSGSSFFQSHVGPVIRKVGKGLGQRPFHKEGTDVHDAH